MPRNDTELLEVMNAYGIIPEVLRQIRSGRVNRHWRVRVGGREYALRRYRPGRTPASIAFEHDALNYAASKGWPAPVPIASPAGASLVTHGDSLYALFPFHEGRPVPARSKRYLRIKGRLLARLHRDMIDFDSVAQRPGFGRMWELDYYMGDPRPFNDMVRVFSSTHQEAASAVRAQRYRNLRELSRLGYGELPDQFGHFDFHHDNLLFSGGELTGLIDFDSSHLDARVADIATSIALDCCEPPAYDAIDPAAVRAFVAGYAGGSRLSEQELALVVPLVRSWIVAAAAGRIGQWLASPEDGVLAKIHRTVNGRIPAFEHRREELMRAVRDGAAEGART